jgi:hypothetical protein
MHVGFTYNSDTPYAPMLMDLSDGPLVIELPPGPLICIAMDVNHCGSPISAFPARRPEKATRWSSSFRLQGTTTFRLPRCEFAI